MAIQTNHRLTIIACKILWKSAANERVGFMDKYEFIARIYTKENNDNKLL